MACRVPVFSSSLRLRTFWADCQDETDTPPEIQTPTTLRTGRCVAGCRGAALDSRPVFQGRTSFDAKHLIAVGGTAPVLPIRPQGCILPVAEFLQWHDQ